MMDDLCAKYLAQVTHLYGGDCARGSAYHEMGDGYMVAVAPEVELTFYAEAELERMVAVLSARKSPGGATFSQQAALAQKLNERRTE